MQYSFIGWDELNQFSESQFTFVLASLRSEARTESYTVATMNPDPDSWILNWIAWYLDETGLPREDRCGKVRHFVVIGDKPVFADTPEEIEEMYPDSVWVTAPDGEKIYVRPKTFTFINGTIFDNPALIRMNPGYLAELNNLPDIEKQRQLFGNWHARAKGSSYFERDWLHRINNEDVPKNVKWVRPWDKASSEPSEKYRYPDYTASVLMGKDAEGHIYIKGNYHESSLDESTMVLGRFRKSPGIRDQLMLKQAYHDGPNVTVVLPKDPGGAGQTEYTESAKKFNQEGFIVRPDPTPGNRDKLTRFLPFSSAAQNGSVYIIEDSFENKNTLDAYYKELESFDGSRSTATRKDDWADVTSSGYNFLSKEKVHSAPVFTPTNSPTLKSRSRI